MHLQVILEHRSDILIDFILNVSFNIEKGNNL